MKKISFYSFKAVLEHTKLSLIYVPEHGVRFSENVIRISKFKLFSTIFSGHNFQLDTISVFLPRVSKKEDYRITLRVTTKN